MTLLTNSGCGFNAPVSDLISPPKPTVDQSEIFAALTNSVSSSLTLKYPKSGEHLSAFVFDETGEKVMVFYELDSPSTEATIWLTFLEKDGGKWACTYDLAFPATDIEKVEFAPFGKSSKTERESIIISYSYLNQPGKNLRVISLEETFEKNLVIDKPIISYQRDFCAYYEIINLTPEGENALLTINQSTGDDLTKSVVEFVSKVDGEFITTNTVSANPDAIEYIKSTKSSLTKKPPAKELDTNRLKLEYKNNIRKQKIKKRAIMRILGDEKTSKETTIDIDGFSGYRPHTIQYDTSLESSSSESLTALFLEYYQADSFYNTGIITFDGENPIKNIVFAENESERREHLSLLEKRPNALTAHAYSRDIDNDGTVNPAGNRPFPGYNGDLVELSERVRATLWYDVTDNGDLVELYYTYLGINDDFVVFLPSEWKETVTPIVKTEDKSVEVEFWEYDEKKYKDINDFIKSNKQPRKNLLSIISVPKGEKPQKAGEKYLAFDRKSNPNFDYFVKTSRATPLRELREIIKIF